MSRIDPKSRVDSEPALVLHTYPYRETSLLVEAFTLNYGRIAVVARGARRPHSAMRGLLLSFAPLSLAWYGKSELRTLHRAEWAGGLPPLGGTALLCGLYLNELLLRLLPRDDPHQGLFATYRNTLGELARGADPASVLRIFEISLLGELGYAPTFAVEADSGSAVEPERIYTYVVEQGPVPGELARSDGCKVKGKTLLDMAANDYSDPVTQQQSKLLMRQVINHYLGAEPLYSRRLFQDLQTL